MNRSWVVSAVMWAIPVASRTTATFADEPGDAAVPLVCGNARAVTHTRRPGDRKDRDEHDHEQHAHGSLDDAHGLLLSLDGDGPAGR